jgi:hypothetical protein
VPTGEGDIFFKAVSPVHPHEPALLGALARWSQAQIPQLLAVDKQRGWILMRDAGQRLREMIRPGKGMQPWLWVLPRYAELQIELSGRASDLLSLGVPDRRLSVLPTRYEPLLADVEVLRIGQTPGLTRAQYERLLVLGPRVAELSERLAEHHIPETLNHGDLNDGNVFAGGECPVFIDWGDACVSHPFYSLRTVLVSAEISLRLEENSPKLYPLRDAYLEPWTRFEPRADLLEALDLSSRLASINGALTWHRLVSRLDGALKQEYAEPVPALLGEFLEAEMAAPG